MSLLNSSESPLSNILIFKIPRDKLRALPFVEPRWPKTASVTHSGLLNMVGQAFPAAGESEAEPRDEIVLSIAGVARKGIANFKRPLHLYSTKTERLTPAQPEASLNRTYEYAITDMSTEASKKHKPLMTHTGDISVPARSAPPAWISINKPKEQSIADLECLSHAPGPTSANKSDSMESLLSQLGFKRYNNDTRDSFLRDITSHIGDSDYKFLKRVYNETAFNVSVREFLEYYGKTYWGQDNRDHLEEKDILKGFLYPRDTEREGSRLKLALEQLFDLKARKSIVAKKRSVGGGKFESSIVMTGRAVDAFTTDLTPAKPHKASLPVPISQGKRRRVVDSSDEDVRADLSKSWNFLTPVVMENQLRPLARKDFRMPVYTGVDLGDKINERLISSKPRRTSEARPLKTSGPFKRRKKPRRESQQRSVSRGILNRANESGEHQGGEESGAKETNANAESSTDSDRQLIAKSSHSRFTPPTTVSRSVTAPAPPHRSVVTIESSQEREIRDADRDSRSKSKTAGKPRIKSEFDLTKIKDETLSWDARSRTELLVSTSNEKKKAPITVSLRDCRTSEDLFTVLTKECELRSDIAKKVRRVSATYKWNGKRPGLRRAHPDDWKRFEKAVGKAWEAEEFADECEIEMIIHVEE